MQHNNFLSSVSTELGLLPSHVRTIVKTAPLRYKVFYIPKKKGGLREVAQPAREVKTIQRWIIKSISNLLPVHNAATAYKVGASIKTNAARHAINSNILKMDFENFFPSITVFDIHKHLQKYCAEAFDEESLYFMARVCTWARERNPPLRLCIGAPSSPLISNSILYDFDERLTKITQADNVVYTRYADDITLSSNSNDILKKYPFLVQDLTKILEYPKLKINDKKTVFASRAGHRFITGVTLTNDQNLSIGRERKRLIRAMYHRMQLGLLDYNEIQKLQGLIAFAENIEPGFTIWLTKKVTN